MMTDTVVPLRGVRIEYSARLAINRGNIIKITVPRALYDAWPVSEFEAFRNHYGSGVYCQPESDRVEFDISIVANGLESLRKQVRDCRDRLLAHVTDLRSVLTVEDGRRITL